MLAQSYESVYIRCEACGVKNHLPSEATPYLGVALLIAIGSFSLGGIIGAFMHVPPTDAQITSITGLISFLAGSLVGKKMEERSNNA